MNVERDKYLTEVMGLCCHDEIELLGGINPSENV